MLLSLLSSLFGLKVLLPDSSCGSVNIRVLQSHKVIAIASSCQLQCAIATILGVLSMEPYCETKSVEIGENRSGPPGEYVGIGENRSGLPCE